MKNKILMLSVLSTLGNPLGIKEIKASTTNSLSSILYKEGFLDTVEQSTPENSNIKYYEYLNQINNTSLFIPFNNEKDLLENNIQKVENISKKYIFIEGYNNDKINFIKDNFENVNNFDFINNLQVFLSKYINYENIEELIEININQINSLKNNDIISFEVDLRKESKLLFEYNKTKKYNYLLSTLSQKDLSTKLPENFNIEQNLVNIAGSGKIDNMEISRTDIEINNIVLDDLNKMGNAYFVETGNKLIVLSGYRSVARQTELYNYYRETLGKNQNVATIPGTSEHHLGTALDFGPVGLDWLEKNSYRFGFVKSYNKKRFEPTGITDENWHYRWVGETISNEYKNDTTMCFYSFLKNKIEHPNTYLCSL